MKNALRWSITALGISCLVFFLGLFIGRRSLVPTATSSEVYITEETTLPVSKININTADADQLQQTTSRRWRNPCASDHRIP